MGTHACLCSMLYNAWPSPARLGTKPAGRRLKCLLTAAASPQPQALTGLDATTLPHRMTQLLAAVMRRTGALEARCALTELPPHLTAHDLHATCALEACHARCNAICDPSPRKTI